MPDYPVQISKVQAPPLRDETLARDRLLEWMSVKVHRRAVLLIAEAGYGKTTLLADFSRRTRVRTLWFRLDRGDRDWVGFLAYLVAAVRIHVPEFGQSTSSLLRETATTAPPMDSVLDTFLRELGGLPSDATAFVFDDFHLVDDSPDVRHIVRELLARGPERLSFVFASRREPPIRLARLRALGEVAELATDDLRFDAAETERLFRETYAMRLEPAILAELSRRTEGWAASLQLVRSALSERNPAQVRAFISSLSGAEGHLYEYLAEEVVGELPGELQQFLMRTSLLDTVDLVLGPVAAEVSEDDARRLIEDGERNGLFGRHGATTRHQVRAHPLVRDFLQARLARAIGDSGVRAIHLAVARAAEDVDWQISAKHFLAAQRPTEAGDVIANALDRIVASGAYSAAYDLALLVEANGLPGAPGLILRSRISQQLGDQEKAVELAEDAFRSDPESSAALVNLIAARTLAGDVRQAIEASRQLERRADLRMASIGRAYRRLIETSVEGSLQAALDELQQVASIHRESGATHFLGVSLANESIVRISMGEADTALARADEAITLLSSTSSRVELTSARLARSMALAHLGLLAEARREHILASEHAPHGQVVEIATEAADMEAFYGDPDRAAAHLRSIAPRVGEDDDNGARALWLRAIVNAASGAFDDARKDLDSIAAGAPRSTLAFELRRQLAWCLVGVLAGADDAEGQCSAAESLATRQGASLWVRYASLLRASADRRRNPSEVVKHLAIADPVVLSMAAESVVSRLGELDGAAFEAVAAQASIRPDRWRSAVRRLARAGTPHEGQAAILLDQIGDASDVPLLRSLAKAGRGRVESHVGRGLARRLASRVLIDDLGRVRIAIGERVMEGSEIRRKVLALLCFLMTRNAWTATREEVVDALWPEQDPQSALNSLNQTVYFLRRVFEPNYTEEVSPGYVHQDGETIWIDPHLVDSRSRRCLELMRSMPGNPTPEGTLALATEYRGRFAMDFAYEDWASTYRDALHASYLRVVEHAVRIDLDTGHFGRGTFVAERAAEIDPDVEEIQVALVRLYRLSGAHAAAAEQYGHYAATMRDLGVEPVSLSDL